jgi:diguanylate cyclase (GGDEF)-like protein
VCTDTPLGDLRVLAEKLRECVAQMVWEHAGVQQVLTCSFGVASFPNHADGVESLFIAADSALYRAKSLGRNRVECAQPVVATSFPENFKRKVTGNREENA